MERSPEYQNFLDAVYSKEKIDMEENEETVATQEEIGWWKQFQVRRAIHHARYETATGVEIHLLDSKKKDFVSPNVREKTRQRERE